MLTWGGNNWEAYEVSGTLMDVYNAISAMPEAGKAEWNDSTYTLAFDDNGIVTSVEAVINPKITMPTWVDSAQAPQAAQDEWNRWFTALEDHENGHVQIVYDNATGVDDRMVGKSKTDAETEWKNTFANIQKLSDEYDARTQNGKTEGTVMDEHAGEPDSGDDES